ncbi:MAG: NFACT family protein, partial [bacterium]|nr:NFACT family protein [bacterium]
MDIFVLNGIVKELNDALAGERLQKIGQPDPLSAIFAFGRGGRRNLLISADPALPRMHLVEDPPPNLATPPSFCRSLRKHLAGARLERLEIRGWERVVQLTFERAGERGPEVFALMAELMGRWSNLILVEGATGKILDAVKMVPEERTRKRPVQRGSDYRMPPGQAKPDPDAAAEADIRRMWDAAGGSGAPLKDRVRALVDSISGLSPQNAEALLRQGESPPEIWGALCAMRDALHRGALSPFLLLDENGEPAGLSAHPPERAPA